MKRNFILLCSIMLLFALLTTTATAQKRKVDMADFEKRKMEFIAKEAGLTQEEADRYFPIYNELSKKKFELHRQHRERVDELKRNNRNMSDAEYKKILDNDVEIRLKEVEYDKEYSGKFEKALPPEKLYKAQQAERKFLQNEVTKFRGN